MVEPELIERRADGRMMFELRGEVSELKATVMHVKDGIDKINSKFDSMIDREASRDLAVKQLADSMTRLVDHVNENEEIMAKHISEDTPIKSWLNNKVASGVFFVLSLIATAFIMQIVIPKLFGN